MKKYFMGIDGGGTKTACLLTDEEGRPIASHQTTGSSYREIGIEAVCSLLQRLADHCILAAGLNRTDLSGIVIGLPCFGESRILDDEVEQKIVAAFAPVPCWITNDVEVGFAGSLGLKPGVHIVAGTGSIAFGKNSFGTVARSGGWSAYFGDEGSCCWLGRRMMELFSKQADRRAERAALYDLVMEHFSLQDAMDFIDRMETDYVNDRDQVASLQRLLLQAARAKDPGAIKLYEQAAAELALLVKGIVEQLALKHTAFTVSYSGGLFFAEELVLKPLAEAVAKLSGKLMPPLLEPVEGAVLLAVNKFSDKNRELIEENLRKYRRT